MMVFRNVPLHLQQFSIPTNLRRYTMNTIEAIRLRKSVRKFKHQEISEDMIKEILAAGLEAPSVKNGQPWKFYVLRGETRKKLAEVMNEGLGYFGDDETVRHLPFYASLMNSIEVIKSAPAVILVFNTGIHTLNSDDTLEARFMNCGAMQTMGAAIQNMLLAATDLGLGSLWICDVFFAYDQICGWLGESSQLAAAVALGHSADNCKKAVRHDLNEHVIYPVN